MSVISTLHIGLFFPKVDEMIDGDFGNSEFLGSLENDCHEETG